MDASSLGWTLWFVFVAGLAGGMGIAKALPSPRSAAHYFVLCFLFLAITAPAVAPELLPAATAPLVLVSSRWLALALGIAALVIEVRDLLVRPT